ncbi:hypothetical protein FQN54_000407 [Arachnomyces sp. PD_36]|nr:hypothetical protein FQN54_000407 [Arachnomyces sp. PD_36]
MSTSKSPNLVPHELRTAHEPRQDSLYPVRLSKVTQVNPTIRLLQLTLPLDKQTGNGSELPLPYFGFQPGQWLDVHVPSIPQAGGFTITSTPADAMPLPPLSPFQDAPAESAETEGRPPYVELAVQNSPSNPAAAWLWKPEGEILGKELGVRVGGSFVWPPPGIGMEAIKKIVFVAGGVGINPLISILSHLHETPSIFSSTKIHFLYSSRLPTSPTTTSDDPLDQILFLTRLRQIVRTQHQPRKFYLDLHLFLTNLTDKSAEDLAMRPDMTIYDRRITGEDIPLAIGEDARDAVCYICGPPNMTDELVGAAKSVIGEPKKERVFCEKWW